MLKSKRRKEFLNEATDLQFLSLYKPQGIDSLLNELNEYSEDIMAARGPELDNSQERAKNAFICEDDGNQSYFFGSNKDRPESKHDDKSDKLSIESMIELSHRFKDDPQGDAEEVKIEENAYSMTGINITNLPQKG